MQKSSRGRFFEHFSIGETLHHPGSRTIGAADATLYMALFGGRFPLQLSAAAAQSCGLAGAPIDELLLFHIVFGKTVADVSFNAVANLGYADCRWLRPVFPGDTIAAESQVIGLRSNETGKTGIVYVRTTGRNQQGEAVIEFVRWVMVAKADPAHPAPIAVVPELPARVDPARLLVPAGLDLSGWDHRLTGQKLCWEDYAVGERIDHIEGVTIAESEHRLATRLFQNNARAHFDAVLQRASRFGRPLVYGGHIISLARALSFNGLGNAVLLAAINAGRHVAPAFPGDTVYCWSEVVDMAKLPGRADLGALRLLLVAVKDAAGSAFPRAGGDAAVLLELDVWVLMPRRGRPA